MNPLKTIAQKMGFSKKETTPVQPLLSHKEIEQINLEREELLALGQIMYRQYL